MTVSSVSLSDPPPDHGTWQELLRSRGFRQLFFTAFAALLVSKGGALLPGMAPDDYFFAIHGLPGSIVDNLVAVGRGLNALLVMALNAMGASATNVSGLSFLLACVTIALAIAISVSLLKSTPKNRIHDYIACIFAAAHPYLTSYFLFRMSILNTAVVYAALALALLLVVYRRSIWHTAMCALLITVFCHMSQIILILFAIAAGAWSLARFCRARENGANLRDAVGAIVTVIVVLGIATIAYLASSAAIRAAMHVAAIPEYAPHLVGGLGHTLKTAFNLAYEVLLAHESIEPRWLKFWVLIAILVAIAACVVRKPLRGIAAIALLVGGLLASVSPLALSWGGLVPRTFSPAGLCLALVFCFACDGASSSRVTRSASALLALPALCFCLIGASLFYQQLLLTHWDQQTAAAIFARVAPQTDAGKPIRLVAAWPIYRQRLSYGEPGVNESAFLHSWDYQGLFGVATGSDVDVIAGDPSLCRDVPAWPSDSSTKRLDDGSTLVCMAHQAKTIAPAIAVQRNYPSVAQEKALKLKYPLFLAYGRQSARLTPFFPGTSEQPVSVKLASNPDGYTLQAQDASCAFPVDYVLNDPEGRQLDAGEYQGAAPIHLSGWDQGTAILAVHMAGDAKNNYGCNLVIEARH